MFDRWHSLTRSFVTVLVLTVLAAGPAQAQPEKTAASAFDEGVELFEHARFAEAARAFLRADEAVPSSDALSNALSAARRANDHLLVAEIAQRAVRRDGTDPVLAARARRALAEASTKLAALDLACEPAPCALTLDGKAIRPGSTYVLPGNHAIAASGSDGGSAEESINLDAGARYHVVLHPVKPGNSARAADVSQSRSETPGAPKPEPVADRSDGRPLAPGWFYTGIAVTVVLAGATTWSGLDALSAKSDLPAKPTSSEVNDVRGKVRRTDILLTASALVGAATAYAGFELVHWNDTSVSGSAAPGVAFVSAQGRF